MESSQAARLQHRCRGRHVVAPAPRVCALNADAESGPSLKETADFLRLPIETELISLTTITSQRLAGSRARSSIAQLAACGMQDAQKHLISEHLTAAFTPIDAVKESRHMRGRNSNIPTGSRISYCRAEKSQKAPRHTGLQSRNPARHPS